MIYFSGSYETLKINIVYQLSTLTMCIIHGKKKINEQCKLKNRHTSYSKQQLM
jgi:hypothetical protein